MNLSCSRTDVNAYAWTRSEPSFDGLGGFEPPDFDFADHCVIHLDLLGGSLVKRHTRLELVTSTMARWRTTNCANAAWCGVYLLSIPD